MMRVIVTPAVLPPSALAELKDWLGITTTVDDTGLSTLLAAAVDVCTDFIGLVPLAATVEETIPLPTDRRPIPAPVDWQHRDFPGDWRMAPIHPGYYALDIRPVTAVSAVYGLAPDGTRTALDPGAYTTRIEADGTCEVRVTNPGTYTRAAVSFTAGLAADWTSLPVPLRHGIVRLAAHQYRTRETVDANLLPPASVAALWRPWRRVRLA